MQSERKVNKPGSSGTIDLDHPDRVLTHSGNDDRSMPDPSESPTDDAPSRRNEDRDTPSRYDEDSDRPLGSGGGAGGLAPPVPWR